MVLIKKMKPANRPPFMSIFRVARVDLGQSMSPSQSKMTLKQGQTCQHSEIRANDIRFLIKYTVSVLENRAISRGIRLSSPLKEREEGPFGTSMISK